MAISTNNIIYNHRCEKYYLGKWLPSSFFPSDLPMSNRSLKCSLRPQRDLLFKLKETVKNNQLLAPRKRHCRL